MDIKTMESVLRKLERRRESREDFMFPDSYYAKGRVCGYGTAMQNLRDMIAAEKRKQKKAKGVR